MAGNRILGVGWGVFILAAVWCLALVLGLIFYRVRAVLTLIFTSSAALLTAILLALPRSDELPPEDDEDGASFYIIRYNNSLLNGPITDSVFIVRMVVLILTALAGLTGSALLFYMDVVQIRRPVTGPLLIVNSATSGKIENLR